MDADGICVWNLEPGTKITVQTQHTEYNLEIIGNMGRIVIQGGHYFPEPKEARFNGTAFFNRPEIGEHECRQIFSYSHNKDGSSVFLETIVKFGYLVYKGGMEISQNDKIILTSPIKDIHIDGERI